jgi:hypothetical protein
MSVRTTATGIVLSAFLTACVTQAHPTSGAQEGIYETNVTNDLNLASGEPEIAIDPKNPRNLVINEFTVGSAKQPAWSMNPVVDPRTPEEAAEAMSSLARIMMSTDGGNTWKHLATPVYDPDPARAPGGGDPMIAYGPDSTIYIAANPFPRDPKLRGVMYEYNFVIGVSTDRGHTFHTQTVGTPVDRPFIHVDQSTGVVYSASTGPLNPKTGARNRPDAEGAIFDRWLVAWQPHLSGRSEPRRMGGPDFPAASGGTFTAANGVVASVFLIGTPIPGGGPARAAPIPASLRPLIPSTIQTCSMQAQCLFFQTSADQGRTWTRHYVPTPGGFSGYFSYVAADPGRPGRYAIGVTNRDSSGLEVLVTNDSGATWSPPIAVPQAPGAVLPPPPNPSDTSPFSQLNQGAISKPWMDYGPTGVLGFMWKQTRSDLNGTTKLSGEPGRSIGPAFDVYAAISCDGGLTWLPPVRVNAETSPPGNSSFDDLSYIALDAKYAHLVWGDRRLISQVKNAPKAIGGVQAFYGRVPFSLVSRGAKCGR